jgi:hypothetical protein
LLPKEVDSNFLANVCKELNKLTIVEKPVCSLNADDNKIQAPVCQTTIKPNQSRKNLNMNVDQLFLFNIVNLYLIYLINKLILVYV